MSERISDELCLIAAYEANTIFDQRLEAETDEVYGNLTDEFLALQAIAGVRFAQPREIEIEPQIEERLRMTIPALLEDLQTRSNVTVLVDERVKTRVINVMKGEGYPPLRELLIMGYDNVKSIRNLGVKGRDFLEAIRQAVSPYMDWSPRLDGSYAAQLYAELDEIPARVIDPTLHGTEQSIGSVKNLSGIEDAFLRKHLMGLSEYSSQGERAQQAVTTKIREIRQKVYCFLAEFELGTERSSYIE